MDLVTHITGIANSASFTPGVNTPAPYNVAHTGLTDGTSPATASKNQAEIYNRWLLTQAAVITEAGLSIDNANWTQMATAITTLASAGGSGGATGATGATGIGAPGATGPGGLVLANFTGFVLPYAELVGTVANPGLNVFLVATASYSVSRYNSGGGGAASGTLYFFSSNDWSIFGDFDLLFLRGSDGVWYEMVRGTIMTSTYYRFTTSLGAGVMPVQIAGIFTAASPSPGDPGGPPGGPS